MPSFSAVLITYNEENDLPQALASLDGLADEIIVVDSGSTDRTCDLARERGARVFFREFSGFDEQKNFAAGMASHEWMFSMDADEVVGPELRASLSAWKQTRPECVAYEVGRRTNYLGRWIQHSGWYPDYHLRLYRRDRARFVGSLHESLRADGPSTRLSGELQHYTVRSLEEHHEKLETFTTLAAEGLFSRGKRHWRGAMYLDAAWTFVNRLIFRLGFLDGYQGVLIAWMSARYVWMKYRKLGELIQGSKLERRAWPQARGASTRS
jgi:glycosyltransferase involved in cell wall biosynthesis